LNWHENSASFSLRRNPPETGQRLIPNSKENPNRRKTKKHEPLAWFEGGTEQRERKRDETSTGWCAASFRWSGRWAVTEFVPNAYEKC
jgi:hypothetical protein